MAELAWIPFTPAVVTTADRHHFLRYALELADGGDEDHTGRLSVVDGVRRDIAHVRSRSTVSTLARAAVLVLADLIAHGWLCRRVGEGGVEVAAPHSSSDLSLERERVRRQLHVERNRQLQTPSVRAFIASMERRRLHRGRWISIYSLMRDGADLAESLRHHRHSPVPEVISGLSSVIRPYLQLAQSDEICEHTGLRLIDVWRYFRHTWATPYRSVPGRSLMLLVRDAAVELHPIIGIAALASSAVQIGVRDDWIGWTPESFVDALRRAGTDRHLGWLQRLIDDGLAGIYQDDLLDPAISPLTRQLIASPTHDLIGWLESYARVQRDQHQRLADAVDHKRAASALDDRSPDRWRSEAEKPLFRSKRAETLAMLLRARRAMCSGGAVLTPESLRALLGSPDARQAIQSLVRRAKAERVGIEMADISVCGAIPPYSTLLGGKLVAMLLLSSEVVAAYRDRYSHAESVIASSLAGRPVVRPPHLVFLGTTSLYGTEPTQYTRLHVPCELVDGLPGEVVRYRLLGKTEGYGTLQFSLETVDALSTLLSQSDGGQRVHSIFGEGVNPRLRKIREGLEYLGLPADALLTHGSPRLVYGVALARNFREYLLGLDAKPDYFIPLNDPARSTDRIARWWVERWLLRRIQRDDVLVDAATHRTTYPVHHGARVRVPADVSQLSLFGDITGPDRADDYDE
jgi:hypothetical protein